MLVCVIVDHKTLNAKYLLERKVVVVFVVIIIAVVAVNMTIINKERYLL